MRILIIADEVWNDHKFGNNVLTNWFSGFDAEFAEIYCSPGKPINECCYKYFQLTDSMMVRSIFSFKKAGITFDVRKQEAGNRNENSVEQENTILYSLMKFIASEPVRLLRDVIWEFGRYDNEKLKMFIQDFKPDIIFCPRLLTSKLLRLEKTISRSTDSPFVAFTGDDEESFQQKNYSPIYWFRRIVFRLKFKSHIKLYKHYFMHSSLQAIIYKEKYGIETSILYKSGIFNSLPPKTTNSPIKIIYAGRLYVNRWKILKKIGEALSIINKNQIKMILEIYTQDKLSKKQKIALHDNRSIFIKGSVKADKLQEIYLKSDIALHVESLDKKNRLITKYSFSTKIIDLLGSTCAVIAIAWENQAGLSYLKMHDAAICISDSEKIYETLETICATPNIINEYALKAYNCGKENHGKEKIQGQLKSTFQNIINLAKSESPY